MAYLYNWSILEVICEKATNKKESGSFVVY